MNLFRYFNNPSQVTKAIIRWILKAGKLAFISLAVYNTKKLSQKLLNVPPEAIDRLPRRYLVVIYGFSILGTVHFWGILFSIFFSGGLGWFYFLFQTFLFYGISLLIVRSYPRGFLAEVINMARGLIQKVARLIEVIRETGGGDDEYK